jgi:hypothetical protein
VVPLTEWINMNLACRATLVLMLATFTWPATAATDYFWNCTTPDGIKYADASQCDKGDKAVKVMKGNRQATATHAPMVQAAQQDDALAGLPTTGVCPANPAYCTRPDYGVIDGSPRTVAIAQFMRKRACDFMHRFPDRCPKPN